MTLCVLAGRDLRHVHHAFNAGFLGGLGEEGSSLNDPGADGVAKVSACDASKRRSDVIQVEKITEHDFGTEPLEPLESAAGTSSGLKKSPNPLWARSPGGRFAGSSCLWARARTWCPRASICSTVAPPVSPVAPVTKNVRRLMRGYLLNNLDVARHQTVACYNKMSTVIRIHQVVVALRGSKR